MGYNNNNAGMHLMWHSHYGKYDDLEYYDRLIAEQEKEKRLLAEKEHQKQESDKKTMDNNSANKDNKKKTNNKKKYYTASKTLPVKNQSFYGNESIISAEYFDRLSNIFRANVMIKALEKKIDIYGILDECEDIMKRDILVNPPVNGESYNYPRLEKDLVFINLLADKIRCPITELFIENKDKNKEFVYKLIDDEIKPFWEDMFDIYGYDDTGVVLWVNDFDRLYEMTNVNTRITSFMSLSLYKYITKDGKILYSISFGNFNIPFNLGYQYIFRGAFLWEEEEGRLKDLIEDVIRSHRDELISETGYDYIELPVPNK